MNCNCIREHDARLKEKNLHLTGYALFPFADFKNIFVISTDWNDRAIVPKRDLKAPPPMIAAYCPLCGVATESKRE